jgi:hypothetical protein
VVSRRCRNLGWIETSLIAAHPITLHPDLFR